MSYRWNIVGCDNGMTLPIGMFRSFFIALTCLHHLVVCYARHSIYSKMYLFVLVSLSGETLSLLPVE